MVNILWKSFSLSRVMSSNQPFLYQNHILSKQVTPFIQSK